MDRHTLYLTALASLITIAVALLSAANETKLDLYVSIFTLIYLTTTAIFRPRRRTWDFLALALIVAFSYIVVMKVLEILLKP